jgi:hypothetical protein
LAYAWLIVCLFIFNLVAIVFCLKGDSSFFDDLGGGFGGLGVGCGLFGKRLEGATWRGVVAIAIFFYSPL